MTCLHRFVCLLLLFLTLLTFDLSAKRPPKPGKRAKEDTSTTVVDDDPSGLDDSSITVDIEHSIGTTGDFVRRGTVSLRGFKSSRTAVSFQQDSLTQTQLLNIKNAARSGGMYFIRAKTSFSEGITNQQEEAQEPSYIMTVISACSLYNARLSDWITISGDGQGHIIGLTITTPVQTMGMDCSREVHLPHHFNTSVSLDNGAPGPVPNTQGFQEKVEKEEQKKREGTDNRSFLQKYWMYILVGFVALTMVSGMGGGGGQ